MFFYIIQIQDVTEAVVSPPTLPQSHDIQGVWECIVLRKGQDTAFEGADQICRADHEDGVVSELANQSGYARSKFEQRSLSPSQKRIELTSGNINSWWLDNRLFQLKRDAGEETTPNLADVSDKVTRKLQLRAGDVVWCAHRPAVPEVSTLVLCRKPIDSARECVVLRHSLVPFNFHQHTSFHNL